MLRSTAATITFNYVPKSHKIYHDIGQRQARLSLAASEVISCPPWTRDPILQFHLCKMQNCNITSKFIFILSEDWWDCQVNGNVCLSWLLVDCFSGWQLNSIRDFDTKHIHIAKCWIGNVWTGSSETEGVVLDRFYCYLHSSSGKFLIADNYWKQQWMI